MSFGDVKCVAARKRMSDEISMIIIVFLSLSLQVILKKESTLGDVE
jgi:hypothetical protein